MLFFEPANFARALNVQKLGRPSVFHFKDNKVIVLKMPFPEWLIKCNTLRLEKRAKNANWDCCKWFEALEKNFELLNFCIPQLLTYLSKNFKFSEKKVLEGMLF